MKAFEIRKRIEVAVRLVLENDAYLLRKDINERTIAHRLATYLQCVFPVYHVDCEYNGNVLRDNGKKYIKILKGHLQCLGLLKQEETMADRDIIERLVYPDIIVHRRDTTENLCVIEIKKSTSKIPSSYDELKLKCYTSNDNENDLNYGLGVFIEFITGTGIADRNDLKRYRAGKEISEGQLATNYA